MFHSLAIIYVGLIFSNLFYFIKGRRSRFVAILSVFFLLVIMGGNTSCADFEDYKLFYEDGNYPFFIEPGYKWFSSLFSNWGYSFVNFRTIYFTVAFLIAFVALKKLISNYHLILFVYLTYMMILDTVQIRNTMAISFLLLGTAFLVESKKLLFLCSVVIASLFHISFLVFMPIFFYKRINYLMLKHEKATIVSMLIISFWALTGAFLTPLSNLVVEYWGDSKESYLVAKELNLLYLLFPLLYYFVAKMSRRLLYENMQKNYACKYADIVFAIAVLFIFFMPILILSRDSLRIFRDANIELVALVTMVLLSCNRMAGGGYFMRKIQSTPMGIVHALDDCRAILSRICRIVLQQYFHKLSKFLSYNENNCILNKKGIGIIYDLVYQGRRSAYA